MVAPMAPVLLVAAPAPVIDAGGRLRLDIKFLEGMRLHAAHWPGPVRVLLRRGAGAIPFGAEVDHAALGFELLVLDPGAPAPPGLWAGVRALFAGADDLDALALIPAARAAGARVVLALEYTLETRLRIAALDPGRSWPRRLRSMLWTLQMEPRRRAALAAADAVQFNGYPAWDSYRHLTRDPLLYLDNRMTAAMMATPAEMADRAARLRAGAPLRLIHSGRLEPMKGAQDLLAVMEALRARGVRATLDIYGTGSLEGAIRAGMGRFGGDVRLHGPVDFAAALVPATRAGADLFLSCHRQSDPSCTYLEAMGCGAAIAGYANRMWARLAAESGGGVTAPLGRPAALAAAIAAWHADRPALIAAQASALAFARRHDVETVFAARMAHLRAAAGLEAGAQPLAGG
jgi:glycosyltransferase involved in cell wall biosynthesis